MAYLSTNPFNNQVIKQFDEASDSDISNAIHNAHEAFMTWRHYSFNQRADVLRSAANLLRQQSEELCQIMALEMGKRPIEGAWEVEMCAGICEYYAEHAKQILAATPLKVKNRDIGDVTIVHEPLGIILAIEPWNFPLYQVVRIAAPQLAAGNVILLKHASIVPQCAAAIEKIFRDAGLITDGLINLYASRSQIETIINDPRVCGVALTGSEGAGAIVATQAAKALKKSTLELGGSDALIVLPDADLELTVKEAMNGRFGNCGQACVASKRILVAEELYDDFLERYTAAIAMLKPGDPLDETTTLPPLSSQSAADQLKKQLQQAISGGAQASQPGEKVPEQGAFMQPTLLTNVAADNPVYHQELFGPVPMVFKTKDTDHALSIANDSPFGLGGSVFSQDKHKAIKVAQRLSTGMIGINRAILAEPDLPFGGIRRSGYGRELIDLGIKEFVNHKLINGKA